MQVVTPEMEFKSLVDSEKFVSHAKYSDKEAAYADFKNIHNVLILLIEGTQGKKPDDRDVDTAIISIKKYLKTNKTLKKKAAVDCCMNIKRVLCGLTGLK